MSNIGMVRIGCRDQIVVRIQNALNERMLPPYNKITKPAKNGWSSMDSSGHKPMAWYVSSSASMESRMMAS